MGWWASKSLWEVAIWELEEAVRLRQIIPHSKECLDEFSQFKQAEGEAPSKVRGGHDDYIDAWSKVLILRKFMTMGKVTGKSYIYRD